MTALDDISVIIPVREGSSRIDQKIYLPFEKNLNLLEWKVSQLMQVHRSDRIFLSSNSTRVERTANDMGVAFLQRSDYLCDGHVASFSEVITGVISEVPTPYFAWVTVVVPLMKPAEYLSGFESFLEHVVRRGTHDSLVTVNKVKDYLWTSGAPLNYEADRNHTISQELPDIYRVTNALYMSSKADTLQRGYFLGPHPFMHQVAKMSGIDIDELEDYEIALALKPIYHAAAH